VSSGFISQITVAVPHRLTKCRLPLNNNGAGLVSPQGGGCFAPTLVVHSPGFTNGGYKSLICKHAKRACFAILANSSKGTASLLYSCEQRKRHCFANKLAGFSVYWRGVISDIVNERVKL